MAWLGSIARFFLLGSTCATLAGCGFRLPGAEDQDDELEERAAPSSDTVDDGPALSHPPPARSRAFTAARCPFQTPTSHRVECGYVSVPERHAVPKGPKIDVAVAIAFSNASQVADAPAVILQGGPGGAAIQPFLAKSIVFEPLLRDRDLIVIDPRGVGLSRPALTCPEVARVGTSDTNALLAATIACHDELLSQRIPLDAFTIPESAADVDAVRSALGYSKWHIYGVSYGTRLALSVARDFSAGVSSLVLDSNVPPQIDFVGDTPASAEQAFERLFSTCNEQPKCALEHGDLKTKLRATLTSKADAGREFLRDLRQSLYQVEGVIAAPERIEDAYVKLAEGTAAASPAPLPNAARGTDFAWGVYFSMLCSAELPFTTPAAVDRKLASLDPLYRALADVELFDLCAVWAVPPAAAVENQPIASDLPSLVLSGAFDPITPAAFGSEVARTLEGSFEYTLSDQSHGAAVSPCGFQLMNSFLRAPSARPADACVATLKAPVLTGG